MNFKKLMKKAVEASTGIAVAAAFFNVALLVAELVKVVSENETLLEELKEAEAEAEAEAVLEEAAELGAEICD